MPPALIAKVFRPDIWIITERRDQARDNGYCFFKYVKKEHPEQKIYYVIDFNGKDYNKIAPLDSIIQFDSWKHYYYFCLSSVHISAHVRGCIPSDNPFVKRVKRILGYRDVFIPHGVSYGVSEFCLAKYADIDLFICCGKPEYDNILKNYGYKKKQVVLTGFPRLDNWYDIKVNHHQILIMPTWRLYIAQDPKVVFENTEYYKAYQSLINNPDLVRLLDSCNLKVVFYLHHEMQKYAESFRTNSQNIEVVYDYEIYDIQGLLKESVLLITDYSSVHFDFAYMGKPVLYYQFDREEFWEKQYRQTDFDAEKDGFGPVAYDQHQLVENLQKAYNDGFILQGDYEHRMKQFYTFCDNHNCERVYEAIKRIRNNG